MNSSQTGTKRENIRKLPNKISGSKLEETIFSHWQKIPVIKDIPEVMPEDLILQEVRSGILDIFRNGIEEYDEKRDLIRVRHVFSVKELHKLIKEKLSKKIKLSNVYFHLNQLKDREFVQIVTTIKEGRQITHYYGRTAKLFLWGGKEEKDPKINKFISLMQYFNPDLTSETIKELYESLMHTSLESHNRVKTWMENNIDTLTEQNMDTRDVYSFLRHLDKCDSKSIELYSKISELLNFPID